MVATPLGRALVLGALVLGAGPVAAPAFAQPAKDLSGARALDAQGARAYSDGRYADAIRYFEEAYRLGAPPVELWNIAKCHDRVDQPEYAAQALERYLALPDLPKSDRDEAQQMLDGIKKRSSSLTITSSPDGASVAVDGKLVPGRTPVTTSAAPGRHDVTVSRTGHAPYGATVEARFGRAVIVDATLRAEPEAAPAPSSRAANADASDARDGAKVVTRAFVGLGLPRYGAASGDAAPTLGALVAYRIGGAGNVRIALGGMLRVAFDSWKATANDTAPPCGAISGANDGVAITGYGALSAVWKVVPELDAGALLGLGLAGLAAGPLGGEVFEPTCSGRAGVKPSLLLGVHADWKVTQAARLSLYPILVDLQPAFDGARTTPLDASGLWTRFTFAVGGGFDL
jgi:hypothetical protein